MNKLFLIAAIGYFTCLFGYLLGVLFSFLTIGFGKKFQGAFLGFTAGLLISFVCFEMLPIVFENYGLVMGVTGISLGAVGAILLESILEKSQHHLKTLETTSNHHFNLMKTGYLTVLSVVIHKIPEGLAIGSFLNHDLNTGLTMAFILSIHCFPEGAAMALPLQAGGIAYKKLIAGCFFISIPMALGSILGATLSNVSNLLIALCLSFSGGLMIYIACGEMIPESKNLWRGKISAVGSALGFITGVVLTAKL